MAKGPTFVVKFRRRRQNKTDYKKRMAFLKSKKPRLVIRMSNKHASCQIMKNDPKGDVTISFARSCELKGYGYKGNTGNRTAAYLTGFLCGLRAEGVKSAILDIGLQRSHPKGRIYSALLGAIDSGLSISHKKDMLPDKPKDADKILEKMKKPAKKPAVKKKVKSGGAKGRKK